VLTRFCGHPNARPLTLPWFFHSLLLRRQYVLLALVCLLFYAGLSASEPDRAQLTPLEVVRAYTDAANRGDLEAFLACYAPGIRKFKFPGEKVSEGLDHMRAAYTRSFAEKRGIHVETLQTIILGDKVVCQDHVTGLPGGKSADELTVYKVENGLITDIVYVDRREQSLETTPR